jgi:hypothetical protein
MIRIHILLLERGNVVLVESCLHWNDNTVQYQRPFVLRWFGEYDTRTRMRHSRHLLTPPPSLIFSLYVSHLAVLGQVYIETL